jgi:seryl-tRNA synthetase
MINIIIFFLLSIFTFALWKYFTNKFDLNSYINELEKTIQILKESKANKKEIKELEKNLESLKELKEEKEEEEEKKKSLFDCYVKYELFFGD